MDYLVLVAFVAILFVMFARGASDNFRENSLSRWPHR